MNDESGVSNYVLYHADCPDGFTAAWAAWRVFGGEHARYIPVQYGRPVPDIPDDSDVYILDFSYPRDELIVLAGRMSRVVVLDHHRTAAEALHGLDNQAPGLRVAFHMGKSGAVLAEEYFHPGEPVSQLARYVQDRDLWRWEMEDSREYSAALAVEPRTFGRWSEVARFSERDEYDGRSAQFKEFIARGEAILAAQAQYVASLASRAVTRRIGDHDVPTVNSPLFQSEIGEALCHANPATPFAAAFFVDGDGREIYSLRSRGGFDVSAVAKSYGGGGHAAAAGFKVDRGVIRLAGEEVR